MRSDCQRPSRPNDVRLQKFLAECGVGSRRACEDLISRGAVSVDGVTLTRPGCKIDPEQHEVRVHGRRVRLEPKLYLMLNKPRDVLCTSQDPRGRRTFRDLLPDLPARVYSVGRLDRDSEGLLLVTNDGELAARLTHPRHCVPRTYRVWTDGVLSARQAKRLKSGVSSRGERLAAAEVRLAREGDPGAFCEVVLHQGRNRQVRRMFDALGLSVRRLKRMRLGPLRLGRLRRGAWRALSDREVADLRRAVCDRRGGAGVQE